MRAVLVDWLVEVADDFRLSTETLYLAIAHMDRFLSLRRIEKDELQLLGVTCLLIASKYEEINPPAIDRFAYVTDNACTVEDIVEVEAEVLHHLGFQISVPTSKVRTPRRQAYLRVQRALTCRHACWQPRCLCEQRNTLLTTL
jgi:cyclin-A